MTSPVVTLEPRATVNEALLLLERNGYEGLPIVENGQVLGLISKQELLEAFVASCAAWNRQQGREDVEVPFMHKAVDVSQGYVTVGQFLHELTVGQLMLRDPVTIGPDEPIELAASRLAQSGQQLLPVIDSHGQLVGIVAEGDILSVFQELFGFSADGARLVFYVDDRPGRVAQITDTIRRTGANITSIVTSRTGVMNLVHVVIKVPVHDKARVVAALEQAGLPPRWVDVDEPEAAS